MNIKGQKIEDLVVGLASRSKCRVRVSALIYDRSGVFAWGWNFGTDTRGVHAEAHAVSRANRKRLDGARLIVYGVRAHGKEVEAIPCENCLPLIKNVGITAYTYKTKGGGWKTVKL